jgi:hypothetical protein
MPAWVDKSPFLTFFIQIFDADHIESPYIKIVINQYQFNGGTRWLI